MLAAIVGGVRTSLDVSTFLFVVSWRVVDPSEVLFLELAVGIAVLVVELVNTFLG